MSSDILFDFDRIDEWEKSIDGLLAPLLPADYAQRLGEIKPEYVEDARDLLLRLGGREALAVAVLAWLRNTAVAAYHATRITEVETLSIEREGLLPLVAEQRKLRLTRALRGHARWNEVESNLDAVISRYGRGKSGGRREGQVHLTLSRGGLLNTFDHYLAAGAEIDLHMARELLGDQGVALLTRDGVPTMFRVIVPGAKAIDASHPYFNPTDMLRRGDLPNIVGEILTAWAFKKARPGYEPAEMMVDCGLVFETTVPAAWIIAKETFGMDAFKVPR